MNIDFPNQILLESIDCKRFWTRKYYLRKGIIENYNIIINGKKFYDQAIDSEKKNDMKTLEYYQLGKVKNILLDVCNIRL